MLDTKNVRRPVHLQILQAILKLCLLEISQSATLGLAPSRLRRTQKMNFENQHWHSVRGDWKTHFHGSGPRHFQA